MKHLPDVIFFIVLILFLAAQSACATKPNVMEVAPGWDEFKRSRQERQPVSLPSSTPRR